MNIRGKLITGVIKTTKMKNTVIIRKDYLHYIKKYNRFEKRHKNTPVHVSPAFRVKAGDEIMAGQCRCAAAQFASCFVPQAAFRALPVTLLSSSLGAPPPLAQPQASRLQSTHPSLPLASSTQPIIPSWQAAVEDCALQHAQGDSLVGWQQKGFLRNVEILACDHYGAV